MKKLFATLLASSLIALTTSSAQAQDTITLRMGDFLPATHKGVLNGDDVFIKQVEELTNNKVKIEFYPAQQAGGAKEALDLVKNGAVDLYALGTAYYSAEMPLWGLLEAPNLVHSICNGTKAMREIGDPGGILWKSMYEPQGIRILSYFVYPPYGPAASRKPVDKVSDLEGLKMRNAGGLMERTVLALGAIPVGITSPEVMQSLQRGTLDSWMGSFSAVIDYEFYTQAKYGATGFSMGTPGIFLAISESKFQSLPKDVQAALTEAGKGAEQNFCAFMEKDEANAIKELQTPKYGLKVHTWTPDQVAELESKTSKVLGDWVKDVDNHGYPASEALKDYKAALAEN